jgi:serine/threonine protein kinase
VHRDLKPVNFLVKNGAYKLCDFGSAVFGHVDLRTSRARAEAEEVIEKTTTQMFRSPEMVDLYVSKKLTQSTDVWALGCCLYSLAFLQNCFEEGSNLAILSRNYKIPDNNPYGPKLAELIDRMLTVNSNERADMTEVILCLSAIYSGRPLPPRRKKSKSAKGGGSKFAQKKERVGTYRTDGQGIREKKSEEKKPVEAKKLNPNSAAARRRKAAQTGVAEGGSVPLTRTASKLKKPAPSANVFDQSFSDAFTFTSDNGSAAFDNGGSAFSGTDDPFHVGDTFGAFKDDYESSELSQDGVFDFVSDNGSGFDTFGSEDGSRNQGFTDRSLQNAVTKANKDYSGEVDNLNFDNLRVAEDDGDINRDYDKSISSTGDMKKKKKGIKGFFRRDNNEVEI